MRRTDVPATKSNLLRLKEHFGFIKSGHELLDQKRQILLEELLDVYRESGQARQALDAALRRLYAYLREAMLANGRAAVEAEALAAQAAIRLGMRERSIMGVVVPLLDVELGDAAGPTAAPGWNSVAAAQAARQVHELLSATVRMAEIEISCRRLATELQKTRRKVNALEHVFIPEYRDTIHFIESSLEEKERESLFQMKRFKARPRADAGEA
ncbi:MAG TPA: V-type ATP synthase subunit D [Candidatus Kryptonia bacterium]|nr:V-type ATP synthase subunit D [Candidatus Kryptonia bacterium]